jgi:hypothetical protein
MRLLTIRLFSLLACCLAFFGCQKQMDYQSKNGIRQSSEGNVLQENTFKGPQVTVGNGHARTFVTINHEGVPQEIGVVFTHEALSGLATVNTPYVLQFHNKALKATPFQHLAMGWSANGHPLPNGFIGPHFDVRFFMMSLEERLAIPPPPAPELSILPPTGYMPSTYFPDVAGPQLGMHWTDVSFSPGVPVWHTLILGSFNGSFNFVSPIVQRTFLQSGTSVSLPYAQPQSFEQHGYYPTRYNIYEDDKLMHYVTLSDFVWR